MTSIFIPRLMLATLCAITLLGCSQKPGQSSEPPRPVKVEQIGATDSQVAESLIGTIRARQRASLGFESGGKIAAMLVDVGDRVRAGQVLARLDTEPAQARLAKAEADRKAMYAMMTEREAQLRRTQQLERDRVVSPASLETAQTQYDAALGQLQAADAALVLARRELALNQIKAPFDGQIVARSAQAFADVAPGQPVFEIEDGKTLEVLAAVPDYFAARLTVGQKAKMILSGDGVTLPVSLEKISGRAENGSQVQAIFRIEGRTADLHTGSSVTIALPGVAGQSLSIPATALLPGPQAGLGQIFVLDTEKQRLALRQVKVASELGVNGRLPLLAGIKSGEWVVVAGAPFLSDGQAATRFVAQTKLEGMQP